jgi:hypothetical protein
VKIFVRLFVFTLLFAGAGVGSARADGKDCPQELGQFLGRRIPYKTYAQDEGTTLRQGKLLLSEMFPGQGQVVLGLEPNGHFYMVADGARFDGDPFTFTGRRHRGKAGGLALGERDSALFVFKDLPPKVVDQIRLSISNKKDNMFMLSCIDGICRIANQAGLQINDTLGNLGRAFMPGATLERILGSGFRLKDSKEPVNFEVYLPEGWTLEKLLEHQHMRDRALPGEVTKDRAQKLKDLLRNNRKAQLATGALGVGAIVIGGGTVLVLRPGQESEQDDQASGQTLLPEPDSKKPAGSGLNH